MDDTVLQTGEEQTQTTRQSFGPDTEQRQAVERNLGKLADPECAKEIIRLFISQDPLHKKHRAQWKVNRLRKDGVTGVALIKRTDTQEWKAYAPPGSSRQVPALNKAARLCRLLRATLFVDPPVPEATPSTDADEDRDSAELSTRALIDLGSEGNLDNAGTAEQACELSSIYGSGFRHYYTDPQGGGLRPMQVQATQAATSFNPADPKSSLLDPTTGQMAPPPYVTRYVLSGGQLTDDPKDKNIQQVWTPKLCVEVLSARHVRFLPATARDIWRAQGVVIAGFITLDELRLRIGDKVPSDAASLKKLTSKPSEDVLDLLPGGRANVRVLEQEKISGDSLVFVVRIYYKQGPAYPMGFYGIAAGQDMLLYRSEWYNKEAKEPLDLPVDQIKQIDDEDDQYGIGLMQVVGPANEIRAGVLGSQLEHLDRFLNRKVFYPITAPLQARAAQASTGTYIPTTPGGIPKTEDVPDFPMAAVKMFDQISVEMDHESGLEPPASGENPPNVQSGVHARTIIEQVNVGLSDVRNNLLRGLIRGWRIQLQLVRKDYRIPQRIGWVGDDGEYKEKSWRGADLGTTRDVMLHKGSLSMLAPSAKLAVAEQMSQMMVGQEPVLSAEDLRRIVIGNVGGLIGLEDDPHRMRVRRQIGQWREGPPAGWQPVAPPIDPGTQQPAVDPATGQPLQAQDPVLGPMWAPVPADDDPQVAMLRQHELGRLTASSRYSRWPVEWRAPVDAEYLRMRAAAGIQTASDVQAAQQAPIDAQNNMAQATQQYTDQAAQLGQAVQALQQQMDQLVKEFGPATEQALEPLQAEMKQLEKAVKELASGQADGTKDLVMVAQNVDKEINKLQAELKSSLEALEQQVEQKVKAVAAVPAAAPAAPAPAAPPVFNVHLPARGPARITKQPDGGFRIADEELAEGEPPAPAPTPKPKPKGK